MSNESDILRANFTIQANCPMQNYFSPKAKEEIQTPSQMKKLTTFSEANKRTGSQRNNFSG